jgi:hypothetical protein
MRGGDIHGAVHTAARHFRWRIDMLDVNRVVLLVHPHLEAQQVASDRPRLELAFVDAVRHGANRSPRGGLTARSHDGGECCQIV